jgi:hypothetical protein
MAENAPFLPGLSPVRGKPVHATFDGARLTSDAGVLLLAEIERRLKLADRLARCLTDPRRAACPEWRRYHHLGPLRQAGRIGFSEARRRARTVLSHGRGEARTGGAR